VSARDLLAGTPPSTLVESYYTCTLDWSTSLFNALGISVGNASLAVQAFALLALPLIYFSLTVSVVGCNHKRTLLCETLS
jgi:hypothetical protein